MVGRLQQRNVTDEWQEQQWNHVVARKKQMTEALKPIDWDKPVEYLHSYGLASPVIGVVHSDKHGRIAVIEAPDGLDIRRVDGAITGAFRNVRRKVTREAIVYLNLYPDGGWTVYSHRSTDTPHGVQCRSIHIEWEVEVDE